MVGKREARFRSQQTFAQNSYFFVEYKAVQIKANYIMTLK